MRDRHLINLFLGLNLALVSACLVLVFEFSEPPVSRSSLVAVDPVSCVAPLPSPQTPSLQTQGEALGVRPSAAPDKRFDWRNVWSPLYLDYLQQLRAVGCPEHNIERIVVGDVDEFYARRRLEAAIAHDAPWWKAEIPGGTLAALRIFGEATVQQRADLLARLLGSADGKHWREEVQFWETVPLTGAVLGRLEPETHQRVQEICRQEFELSQREGATDNPVALAKLEHQTRCRLATVLSPHELEEFLLRYSPSAQRLRFELARIAPTSEEFRTIFDALDPLDQGMRLEYGDVSQLSPRQQGQHERLRREAIRSALSTHRFQSYLASLQGTSSAGQY